MADHLLSRMLLPEGWDAQYKAALVIAGLCMLRAILQFTGAICLRKRKSYYYCIAIALISITGVVYYPHWIDVPLGIWLLVGLLRKDTRSAFSEAQ